MRPSIAATVVAFTVICAARADLKSGPAVGDKVPPLKVRVVAGESAGKVVDFAAERRDRPTVYLFVQAEHWGRPMARYLVAIDKGLAEGKEKGAAVAAWLTDKPDEPKEYLPKAQQSLHFRVTALAVATGGPSGPKGWDVNDAAHLTAVVVHRGKVVATFAYRSVNETDAAAVLRALAKAVAG